MKYLICLLLISPLWAEQREAEAPGQVLRRANVDFATYRYVGLDGSDGRGLFQKARGKQALSERLRLRLEQGLELKSNQDYIILLRTDHPNRLPYIWRLPQTIFAYDDDLMRLLQHLSSPGDMRNYHQPIVEALSSKNPMVVKLALVELALGPRDRNAANWAQRLVDMWPTLDEGNKGNMIRLTARYGKLLPNVTVNQARTWLDNSSGTTSQYEDAFEVLAYKGDPAQDWVRIKPYINKSWGYHGNSAITYAAMLDLPATKAEVADIIANHSPSTRLKARLERWQRIYP